MENKETPEKKEKPNFFEKIKDKEKLNWLERATIKRTLNQLLKQSKRIRKEFQKGIREKEEIADAIMELNKHLNIEEEVTINGEKKLVPINKDMLMVRTEERLMDDFEEIIKEAMKMT